jgi:copper chaperone CopZ
MTTVKYTVPNISCMHCVHTIQTEVAEVKGVQSVKADQASKIVEIVFDAPANEEMIKALLAEINYPRISGGYVPAARYARRVVQSVITYGLAANVLLNVNVPFLPEEQIKGIQITRQGLRVYHDKLDRRVDPRGNPYYWTVGDVPTGVPERGTDVGALAEGFVSVTPVQLDLTAYQIMPDINTWDWELDPQKVWVEAQSIFLPG